MPNEFFKNQESLSPQVAKNLSTTTKTVPMMEAITPRWILQFLPWIQVGSGTYRVNRLRVVFKEEGKVCITEEDGRFKVEPCQLRNIPLFFKATDDEVTELADKFTVEQYQKEDVIIRAGVPADKLFVIAQGTVEVSTVGERGQKLQVAIMSIGNYFGELAFADHKATDITVTALTPCRILVLDQAQFTAVVNQRPEFRKRLEQTINGREEWKSQVNEHGESKICLKAGHEGECPLPETFVDYVEQPREYPLSIVQTILKVHTRVADLYNDPIDQLQEQVRLTIEAMKEKQEWELINNPDFGLLNSVAPSMRLQPRYGPPTPDDLDELLARVWKKPALFLAHPKAIAAFGRECTKRGVPPATVTIKGSPFSTWRGVPIIPCNKLMVNGRMKSGSYAGTTSILLMRLGEQEQGVIGLHQTGIPDEIMPSLSLRRMSIDNKALTSYLLTLYFSTAVLTEEALASLDNVEVGFYHNYPMN